MIIPDLANDTAISSTDAVVNNLQVNPGAVLDLTTRKLSVEGTLVNNGTLKQSGTV